MNFNDAMVAVRASAALTVNIPEQWGQGRATFGGMLAAVLFEKVATQVAQDRPIRSVLLSFIAPVAPGAMEVQVKVLREGRGATQVQATAYQNDQACAVLLASFGGDRESMLNVAQERAPAFTAPDEVRPFRLSQVSRPTSPSISITATHWGKCPLWALSKRQWAVGSSFARTRRRSFRWRPFWPCWMHGRRQCSAC